MPETAMTADQLAAARHAANRLRGESALYDRDDAYQDACVAAWQRGDAAPAVLRGHAWRRGVIEGVRRYVGRETSSRRQAVGLAPQFSQNEAAVVTSGVLARPDSGTAAVDAADELEFLLRRAQAVLSGPRLEAVRLRHVEGRSVRDVAGRLGCSPAYVDALVTEALSRLRADPAVRRLAQEE